MSARPGVIFDIDGTLLDSTFHHALAWLRAFRSCGYGDVTAARVHRAVGLGDEKLVPHILGHDDESVATAHSSEYASMQQEVRALPGAADLIANCTSAGLTAVLATSGKAADLDWMLARIGAGTDLAGATTSDDVAQSKPAPDLMLAALAAHELDPARTVAVGDSVWDGRAAQAAGLSFVALRCGGVGEEELRAAGAVEVYDDPAALRARFGESALNCL